MRVWNLKMQTILAFFLVLGVGMLLVNAVSMQLWKRQALAADLDHARSLLAAMVRILPTIGGEEGFRAEVKQIMQSDEAVVCVGLGNAQGKTIAISPGCEDFAKALDSALANAAHSGAAYSRLLPRPNVAGSTLRKGWWGRCLLTSYFLICKLLDGRER